MGALSFTHLLIIVLILLLFFGPTKLPQLGQSLGKAIRGFKEGLNEIDAEVKEVKPQQTTEAQRSQIGSTAQTASHPSGDTSAPNSTQTKTAETDRHRG